MATTHWPGFTFAELPSWMYGSGLWASIFSTAMSVRGSCPITFAGSLRAVVQRDGDRLGVLHHVVVGDDRAVGVDDEAGATCLNRVHPLLRCGPMPPNGIWLNGNGNCCWPCICRPLRRWRLRSVVW